MEDQLLFEALKPKASDTISLKSQTQRFYKTQPIKMRSFQKSKLRVENKAIVQHSHRPTTAY